MDVSECESRTEGETMELQHFSHPHPLVFFKYQTVAGEEVDPEAALCLGCEKPVEGWSYGCSPCEFYLHKECAESELAPQIQNPFHPKHPLTLLPKSPYPWERGVCDFCGKELRGFVYHCNDCGFDLHINCALLQSSIASNFPNSLHPHPLFFIQNHNNEVEPDCSVCPKPISDPFYHCSDCSYPTLFNIHKECADLELAPKIQHPFHPKHLLTLLPALYFVGCDLCGKAMRGISYNCDDCKFNLHINCASLQSSIVANFTSFLHPHPLHFIQNYNKEVELDCSGCQKPISGPFYHCSDCIYPRVLFNLHKECAELPLEINHPCDRKHPLTLLPQPPTHPQKCSCYLCRIQWKGFVYSCSLCNFDLSLDFLFSPPTITVPSHEHP